MPNTIQELLSKRRDGQLLEIYRHWDGVTLPPERRPELLSAIRRMMTDGGTVQSRWSALGSGAGRILQRLLREPGYRRSMSDLQQHAGAGELRVESEIAELERLGFVCETDGGGWAEVGERYYVVPRELGDALVGHLQRTERSAYQSLTLKGWLEHLAESKEAGSAQAVRTRQTYKLLSTPGAMAKRLASLEEPLASFVQRVITGFGGMLTRDAFRRLRFDLEVWDGARWREELEKRCLGTVADLALSRYGIHLNDEVLLLFTEVTLATLEVVGEAGCEAPARESALGVDLVSNVSRFLTSVLDRSVRFTVKGEIFKTTERKILDALIPVSSTEIESRDVLEFVYRFCLARRLVDRTGERVFSLSLAGRKWEAQPLEEKLRSLLEHVVEEKGLPGEHYHQVRLRRILLRILKRLAPMRWYRAMHLPFVVRNHYLASLEDLKVDEFFASRFQYTHYTPMEGVQEMCWNLLTWMRRRLHLLGLIDIGYDEASRPVAFRLSRLGATFLGLIPAGELAGQRTHVIVNPDYEVVLFPGGDEFSLVHALDRFCVREKSDQLYHFRLTEESVRRAIGEGFPQEEILGTLRQHARVPIPQNVLFSVAEWSQRAGILRLESGTLLSSDDPYVIDRVRVHPELQKHVVEVLEDGSLRLKHELDPKRLRELLRSLGFPVE
jgi:hypothetical protein